MPISYTNLVNSIPDILFKADAEGRFIFLNSSWGDITGYSVEESIGRPFWDFFFHEDIEKYKKLFYLFCISKTLRHTCELRCITSHGRAVWLKARLMLRKNIQGEIVTISGSLEDITSERRTYDVIKKLSPKICDIVCMYNMEGTYRYLSPSIQAVTGYRSNEMLGRQVWDFIHPDDLQKYRQYHLKIINDKRRKEHCLLFRIKTKDEGYKWMESFARNVSETSNEVEIISSARPVNGQAKANNPLLENFKKISQITKLKMQLLNIATHELQTPLAIIKSSAELLDLNTDESFYDVGLVKQHINQVFTEITRINNLIGEVVTLSKIESEEYRFVKSNVSVVKLIKEVIESLELIQPDSRKAELTVLGIERDVNVNPSVLRLCVSNLLSNAFKYSKNKKAPHIQLTFKKTRITINVRDFGIGISANDKKHMFEPFFRSVAVSGIEGFGLGMFITKYLIELHKGSIKLNKSADNKGAEFTLRLNY
jgi:PAS domain S-box-containing protein